MEDYRSLEEDYVRRLRLAQESGDRSPVPLIDESRVRIVKKLMSSRQAAEELLSILKEKTWKTEG